METEEMRISLKEIGVTAYTAPGISDLPINTMITVSPRFDGLIQIEKLVCKKLKLKPIILQSKIRKRDYVMARYYIFTLAKMYTGLTLEEIGSRYNGRDHSTVLHGIGKLKAYIETEQSTKRAMEYFESKLR